MPTYEYRCDNCATNFDVVQSFHDDPLTECPTCGSPVRKVFGSVGIVFKGSGFYKTDSRSGGSSSKAAESTVPAAKSDTSPASSGASSDGSTGSDSAGSSSSAPATAGSSSGGTDGTKGSKDSKGASGSKGASESKGSSGSSS